MLAGTGRPEKRVRQWLDSPRAQRCLKWLIVALSLLFLGLFLYAATKRMRYPYEVEWIESGMLVSVLRIVHGQGLYVRPTLDFVPFLYAPVYLYLSAAIMKLWGAATPGAGYAALRLVSAVSTLCSAVVVYLLVMAGAHRRIAGVAAAGLFLACYSIADGFYDIGRVDALFVLLLLLALLAQRRGHPLVAALVWVAVFQTKQTVLPLAVFILLAEWRRPWRMVSAIAVFLAAAGLSVVLLNHATGGWYGFYIFHVARGLSIVPRQAVMFLPAMVLQPMALAWGVIATAFVLTWREALGEEASFYVAVSVALFGGVWFVEAHAGASANALMPVYAWTAVLFGTAVDRLLASCAAARPERHSERYALAVLLAVAVQLMALIYNPGRLVPPESARLKTQQFVDTLRALPGDVYVLNHSYDQVLAGKRPYAEGEALGAVLDAGARSEQAGDPSARLRAELNTAMATHRFTAVIVDDLKTTETSWHFERQYPLQVSTGLSPFRYLTSQAQWFLVPCDAPQATVAALVHADSLVAPEACRALRPGASR